jgi:hypothetical protein
MWLSIAVVVAGTLDSTIVLRFKSQEVVQEIRGI